MSGRHLPPAALAARRRCPIAGNEHRTFPHFAHHLVSTQRYGDAGIWVPQQCLEFLGLRVPAVGTFWFTREESRRVKAHMASHGVKRR